MSESSSKFGVRSTLYPLVSLRKLEALLGPDRDALSRMAATVEQNYRPFVHRSPKGGERTIDNPSEDLKLLQKRINRGILQTVELPSTLMGAARGKSIRDNGVLHVAQRMVATCDIQQFFPSV